MFRRAIFSFAALFALAVAAAYWFHIRIRPGETLAYQKLVQESLELRSRDALEREPVFQHREGVQKDIWAVDGANRLHFLLKSDSSDLALGQKKDKIEAIETLKQLNCRIQDHPLQPPRTISANEGVYYWENGSLKLEGSIIIKQSELIVEAAKGELICSDKLNPRSVILEGDVRLISSRIQDQISFAAADTVVFNPPEKSLIFSSFPPKKVLFWQDGLHLSAKRVLVTQDPETKKESIQGEGDVHFSFDPEEENYIEELFSKYL